MKVVFALCAVLAVASAAYTTHTSQYESTTNYYDTPSTASLYSSGSSYEFSGLCDGYGVGTYVYPGQVVTGNTEARHTTLPEGFMECGSSTATTGVWFTVIGQDEHVTVSSAGSEFDTYLKVFKCDGTGYYDEECVTFNDDCNFNLQAVAHFYARAGNTYKIFLSGYFNQVGQYELAVIAGKVEQCGDEGTTTVAYNDGTTASESTGWSYSYYS